MPSMQSIDWTKLFKQYKGRWVALSDADDMTVVGDGVSAQEALEQAKAKGFANAAVTFVPRELVTFAGAQYEVPVSQARAER